MPDLRQIDADFRKWLGGEYKPLCEYCSVGAPATAEPDGWYIDGEFGDPWDYDAPAIEALIYAAAAQAWANVGHQVVGNSTTGIPSQFIPLGTMVDCQSLESLHAAIGAWHERTVTR